MFTMGHCTVPRIRAGFIDLEHDGGNSSGPDLTGTSLHPHGSSNNAVIILSLVCVSHTFKSRLSPQLMYHRVATGWRIGGSFHQPDSRCCCLINNLRNHMTPLLQKCAIKMVMGKAFHHMCTVQAHGFPRLNRESRHTFFLIHAQTARV